jgi:iron complex transport system ATP-binding protein
MTMAIQVENGSAGYGGVPVLDHVGFSLEQGEVVGIIGPNGCGKTTLLKCISSLLRLSGGSIRLFGEDVFALAPARRAALMAVVPQELAIPPGIDVEELVMIGRSAAISRWAGPSPEDLETVSRAMEYVGVTPLAGRNAAELSGGEKQRAVVAMALAQRPQVMLMDEVTSHLDLNHRVEIMQIIERLNRQDNVTVLMTSHDLNLASDFCKRLLVMDRGRIVADGPVNQVVREDLLGEVFRCKVRVLPDPVTGVPRVFPVRSESK